MPGEVAILHWPEQAAVVDYMRAQGLPRLLLVAPDADAPAASGWDEDWVRLPAPEADVRVRASALADRLRVQAGPRPELRADGRVFFAGRWVAVSPTEQELLRILTDRFEEVVEPDVLAQAGDGRPLSQAGLRVHVARLRKRLGPVGLAVTSVRGRGYVLEGVDPRPRRDAAVTGYELLLETVEPDGKE